MMSFTLSSHTLLFTFLCAVIIVPSLFCPSALIEWIDSNDWGQEQHQAERLTLGIQSHRGSD